MAEGDTWQKRNLGELKRRGDGVPTRYRKLGRKLVCILYKCLVDNVPYDQSVHLKNLHNGP